MFKNDNVEIAALPKVKQLFFNGLDRKYRKIMIFNNLLFSLILLIGFLVFYFMNEEKDLFFLRLPLLIVIGIISLFGFYLAYFGFLKKQYLLREKDIIYRTGLWWRSETSVAFTRVQHSEVIQGPIERFLNLAKLKLYTAGGQMSDLSIPGLTLVHAEELKDFITNRVSRFEEEEE